MKFIVGACDCEMPNQTCDDCRHRGDYEDLCCAVCETELNKVIAVPLCENCLRHVRALSEQGIAPKKQAGGKVVMETAIVDALAGVKWFVDCDGDTYSNGDET